MNRCFKLTFPVILLTLAVETRAVVVFEQPANATGVILHSSWWDPDGSNWDQFLWDGFTLANATAITEIHWRGGFDPGYNGMGGPVLGFRVQIWSSIVGGSQPDVGSYYQPNPLVSYYTTGNCGQTAAGVFGGTPLYDYHYTLPSPFQASAGVKYWVQIEAYQHGVPDWGFASATGGDGYYFRRLSDYYYQSVSGSAAFSLYASDAPTYSISASASPAGSGTISGAGNYPQNSTATLSAMPATGFGFVNWTENGISVSTARNYSFTVTAHRTLVANFTAAYTIATSAAPVFAGTTAGAGIYNTGTNVTVNATANPGYAFVNWSEFGVPVSTSADYNFPASADRTLVANFTPAGVGLLFDFDNAPLHTSLPIDLTIDGLTAHFTGGYSIQRADALGFTPAGFVGYCVYPNSVFAADLTVDFSASLTDFSIMYSPQELGCDDSARLRVSAFMNGVQVGTATATAPNPGTWPTGTLSIHVMQGFNRAVVHYDAPPPTCQDYGVIFLADNMLVTVACAAAAVTDQPYATTACAAGSAVFYVASGGSLPVQYQWQRETSPGSGSFVDLLDGPTGSWDGGAPGVGAIVFGAASDVLVIAADTAAGLRLSSAHAIRYRCFVENACGSAFSDAAALVVFDPRSGDVNGDGTIDGGDIQSFFDVFVAGWTPGAAFCASDMNQDGWVDAADVPLLVGALLGI